MLTIVERVGDAFEERHDTRCRFVPLVRDPSPEQRRKDAPRRRGPGDPGREAPGGEDARGDSSGWDEEAVMKSVEVA